MSPKPDIHVVASPEAPSVGVLVLARDETILEADAAASRLLAVGPGQDLRGHRLAAHIAAEHREPLRLLVDRAFRGEAGAIELVLPDPDGGTRHVQAHASPLRDGAGDVGGAQLTLHDVTERWRADEERANRARAFRALAENVPDNVVLYDRQCRTVYVNPTMRSGAAADIVPVLGLTPAEQSPGVPWALQWQRQLEEILATGRAAEMERPIRTPAGELRMDHVVVAPVRDDEGGIVAVMGIGRDVTARKASEDSLRKLSLAVEQSPASIVITDTGGRIEYVNAKFTEVTGYSAAELLGQNPRILKSGETPPETYRQMWQALTSGRVWRGEFHNRRKNGELYWELATISPVFAANGRITHFLAVKEDITERKRLEDGLRQAQKMDAIGRLAGGVAHDFNNLLTVIQGGAAALRDVGLVQDQRDGLLDEIAEAAERAARLTRQLLTFSQRRPAQPADLDLNGVARNMSQMLGRIIGERIRLVEHLAPGGAPVHADPSMMEQVLLNLVVNARDAMPEGGEVSIRTEVVTEPGEAGRAAPHGWVLLAVSDTGTGIAPEHQPHVFEPFFTTKEVGKGTGLGLAVVFGIVEQHGGRIELSSEPGAGTSVKIWLPLLEGKLLVREPPAAAPVRGGSETLLVVEDDLSVQRMVQRVLEQAGYRVHVAGSAAAALDIWAEQRSRIDLVLTDLVMPGMGGRQLAERLRAEAPSLRVVYTSGYSGDALGDAAVLRGVLEKPYGPEEVLAKVRSCLDEG